MRKLLLILFFIPVFVSGQITFFGVASNPADNGTSTATTVAVTPPASMQKGDLVFLCSYQRGTATMSMSETSGQTWNDITGLVNGVATLSTDAFWCTFNGTWGSDPSVSFTAGTNTNVVMLVFRPPSVDHVWEIDNGSGNVYNTRFLQFSATASPTVQDFNGSTTPDNDTTVSIGVWNTDDDNTWGTLTGTGWSKTGLSAQYRNTSGNDISSSYAYLLRTSISSIPTPSQTQATLGNDPGATGAFCFRAYYSPSGGGGGGGAKQLGALGVGKK